MKHLFALALILAALPALAQTQTAQAPKPPVGVWEPAAPVVPGVARVFYSPSTARVVKENGVKVREVDVKFVGLNGQTAYQTWKVNLASCNERFLDVAIYENGQFIGLQRSVSTTNLKLDSTRMALAACGQPLFLN